MATEWARVSLDELYEFSSGLSKPRCDFGSGYPFLSFKDVFYNSAVPQLTELVNSTEQERVRCSVNRGDVFLTRTSETMDELGMSSVALADIPNATFNGFTKRLRPKNERRVVPEYARYYFRSPEFRSSVTAMSSMSTRASLNNEMLARLAIVLPPPEEQRTIAETLGTLDDKIELNRKMSESLETMAHAIFKAWFVDFEPVRAKMEGRWQEGQSLPGLPANLYKRFPSRLVDSQLGEVPDGWTLVPLGELCTVGRGGSPRPINEYMGGEIPWIKIADATASVVPFLFETKEFLKREGINKTVAVAPGDLILSNSATCGMPIFVEIHGCIHDGWLYFKGYKQISKLYLYQALMQMSEHLVHIADGSVQKNLNTALVSRQLVLTPNVQILKTFDDIAQPIFDRMRAAAKESRALASMRDALLPRLISGRLRISETTRHVSR